jgi:hypothetical protein
MEGAILDRLIRVDAFHDNLAPLAIQYRLPRPQLRKGHLRCMIAAHSMHATAGRS